MLENSAHRIKNYYLIKQFLYGGKAGFILYNKDTKLSLPYTIIYEMEQYRVYTSTHFSSRDYSLLGYMSKDKFEFKYAGELADVSPESKIATGFTWFIKTLKEKKSLYPVEFWHVGRCRKCGKILSDKVSISLGVGPECRRILADLLTINTFK